MEELAAVAARSVRDVPVTVVDAAKKTVTKTVSMARAVTSYAVSVARTVEEGGHGGQDGR